MESTEPPSSKGRNLVFSGLGLFLLAASPQGIFGLILLFVLLFLSALVSGAEVAYFSITPNNSKKLSEDNKLSSKRILKLRAKPRILLATILVCNNFINIGIVLLADFLTRTFLPDGAVTNWSQSLLDSIAIGATVTQVSQAIKFLITVVGATFLLVLFGEVTPKVYATFNNIQLARFMSSPLVLLNRILFPITNVLVNMSSIVEDKLQKSETLKNSGEKTDLDKAIELTVSQEKNSAQEIDILKRIVTFGEVAVKQIMRSRVDMVALSFDEPYKEVIRVVNESGYSRIPVYEENLDQIKGILYVKDLLMHLNQSDFKWQKIIRNEVKFVPEAKKIDELLTEFQLNRTHMAIVVDEFGGTAGLVTLEDIMEEVIGEIKDEFDTEREVEYQQIDKFTYIFEGKTLINDATRVMGIDTDVFDQIKGDSDSIAGLILEMLGRMPTKNIELQYKSYRFKVISANERRIEKVQISLQE